MKPLTFVYCSDVWAYVLDVELEVLGVAEGRLQGLDSELLASLVCKAHQELHDFIGWELCIVGAEIMFPRQ